MGWTAGLIWLITLGPADDTEAVARRVLAGDDYQTAMPEGGTVGPPRNVRDRGGPEPEPERNTVMPDETPGLVARAVLYVLLGVLLAVMLTWAVRAWSERVSADRSREGDVPPPAARKQAPAPVPLPDSERLAREGLYAEAVHAVLLRVLADLSGLAPAWTAREAVRQLELADAAREPLGALVQSVELAYFGGTTVGADEYARALDLERCCRKALAA